MTRSAPMIRSPTVHRAIATGGAATGWCLLASRPTAGAAAALVQEAGLAVAHPKDGWG